MGILDSKKITDSVDVAGAEEISAPILLKKDTAIVDQVDEDTMLVVMDGFTVLAQKPAFPVRNGDKIAKKNVTVL